MAKTPKGKKYWDKLVKDLKFDEHSDEFCGEAINDYLTSSDDPEHQKLATIEFGYIPTVQEFRHLLEMVRDLQRDPEYFGSFVEEIDTLLHTTMEIESQCDSVHDDWAVLLETVRKAWKDMKKKELLPPPPPPKSSGGSTLH